MALLARTVAVVLEGLVDDPGRRVELGPHCLLLTSIARWRGMAEHLAHSLAMDPKHPRQLMDTHTPSTKRARRTL